MFTISSNYNELLNDKNFCEVIDGELMGDGCICRRKSETGNLSYNFCYTTINYDYIYYLHEFLCKKTGSKVKISSRIPRPGHVIKGVAVKSEKTIYSFSISHWVFSFFYNRWYPERKKIFPSIELAPTVCRHWYIGDGSISSSNISPSISLHTECFKNEDALKIISNLSKNGISSHLSGGPIIRIYGKHVIDFIRYIGDCPVQSYAYKWDLNNYQEIRKTCSCGKAFTTYSHLGREKRKHCSDKCRIENKQKALKERLNNSLYKKIINSAVSIDDINKFDKAYILGHIISTGKEKIPGIISIDILDKDLIEKLNKLISFSPIPNYKNKIFIKNPNLKLNDFQENEINHVLRGIFDASGTVSKASDNYFEILIRNKSTDTIKEIHNRIKIGTIHRKGKAIRILKKERLPFYSFVYTNSSLGSNIKSDKKHNMLLCSCTRKRETNQKRDKNGRFLTK